MTKLEMGNQQIQSEINASDIPCRFDTSGELVGRSPDQVASGICSTGHFIKYADTSNLRMWTKFSHR